MHSPAIATKALSQGICKEHRSAPEFCGADRDVALYAAGAVLAVAGVVVGAWALARWLRD